MLTKEALLKLKEEVSSEKSHVMPMFYVSQAMYDKCKKSYDETGNMWSWLTTL